MGIRGKVSNDPGKGSSMPRRLLRAWVCGLAFLAGFGILAYAAYLRNVPVHVAQPDGTVLSCLASGDEFYNWLHDQNGYTIVRNSATGFLVYADKVEGRLVPTEFIAGRTDLRTLAQAGLKARLLDDQKPKEMRISAAAPPVINAPQTGTINNLVVYVRFSDQTDFTQALVDGTALSFNSTAAGADSMRNYYAEASYSQLTVSSTFYPGSTPGIHSYQDAHPRAYYMPYDATTNPEGYNGEGERTTREHTLLRNAVNAIAAEVPAGLAIDGDNDGSIDNICFIVRGEPTAWSTLLWPHQWSLYTAPYAYINGKLVGTYNFQMETRLDVGVLCHEMFHSLGAPDLYHYSSDGLEPAWAWDLMEWELDPPEHMGAYMKWKYGHWIASIPEITQAGTYTLNPLTSSTNNCFKIASPSSSTEFFVVEFRRKTNGGTFEGSLLNEGLLVYRINTAYTGNASGPPDEVYIYRPGGTPALNGVPWLAPFSADQSRTAINDSTDPPSFLTDGTAGGLSISNVGSIGNTISFDVAFSTLTVTSPNGGETWVAGSQRTVTWLSTGSIGPVDILLTTDWGYSWTTLADNTPNDGSQTITVPAVSSSTCFLAVAEGTTLSPYDVSDASFSIIMNPASITVTSPNGGETWFSGSTHDMAWTWTGTIANVDIDYSTSGGVNWLPVAASTPNTGSFPWLVPPTPSALCLVRVRDASNPGIADTSNTLFTISAARVFDLVGTWDGQGVYFRNSDTGAWVQMASPASMVTCGDLDNDGTDDLIGIWPGQGGVWVKYSSSGGWAYIASTAAHITTGDMNGDGRDELLGTWDGQGVFYQDSVSGAWTQMASPASMITSGDLDNDGTDDLIGIWPGQGGVWVKYSSTGNWAYIASTSQWIGAGDMNGDGRDELLGTWNGQGTYYRNSESGAWVLMASAATMITSGDLDGDGTDDLIGLWPSQGGIWVKHSTTGAWELLSSTAQYISAGKMRPESGPSPAVRELPLPWGGTEPGPEDAVRTTDESSEGPGGRRFAYRKERNLVPREAPAAKITWVPGPGENGFTKTDQGNLVPRIDARKSEETIQKKK
jgi:M6 family metalloprotease-like protein